MLVAVVRLARLAAPPRLLRSLTNPPTQPHGWAPPHRGTGYNPGLPRLCLPAMNLPPAARAVLHALACVPDGLSERALLMVLPPLLPADAPPLPPPASHFAPAD